MARKKYSNLDMAKLDLDNAKFNLKYGTDDGHIEYAAYHCSQCIEKVVKYLIKLQGEIPTPSHNSENYLVDLKNEEVVSLVKEVSNRIDQWNNQIRYEHSQLSSRSAVERVLEVCERIIKIAESHNPVLLSSDFPRSPIFNK